MVDKGKLIFRMIIFVCHRLCGNSSSVDLRFGLLPSVQVGMKSL